MKRRIFKVIIEKQPDGYVAYPIGLKGVVVAQGNTYEAAISDVKSAIRCYFKHFGEHEAYEGAALESHMTDIEVAV